MKPSLGSGSRFGRDKFQIAYVNSFGSHRCGTVIHYGRTGHLRHHKKEAVLDSHVSIPDRKLSGDSTHPSPGRGKKPRFRPGAILSTDARPKGRQSKGNEARAIDRLKARKVVTKSLSSMKDSGSGQQDTQGGALEFCSPLETANNCVSKPQKRKNTAWLQVSKVISKMVEENECLRNRLGSGSQLPQEGHAINQNSERGGSCIDTEEAIFGWV
ncbi:uncharacterized protein C5orf47 homolog [Paroedura picta]|uniref:uncharacterized protein C5orf47 homolog n=1 Tax=Paroedura picta TaxID=143630 RepID=UPI0040579129